MPQFASVQTHHAITRSHALRGLASVIATLTLLLVGCHSSLFSEKDYLTRPVTREEVQQIDAIDLAEQSRSKPETVDEATQKVLREVVTPTTAPSSITLTIEEVRA